jgi:hypothetical protein
MKIEGKQYCDTSKLSIRAIPKGTARQIIVSNHYSHLWTKVSYAIGLFIENNEYHPFFDNVNEKLIGVACYGDPVGRSAGQSISPLLDRTSVLELTRLFVFDGYGSNVESWFVGQTFKWLRQHAPHIKALISYSDPKAGHTGIVYQATNWMYQGNKLRFNDGWVFRFDENGEWQHSRTIFPYYGTNDPKIIQTLVNKPFWIKKEPRKHRYIYILTNGSGRKRIIKSLKHELKPYPKLNDTHTDEIYKLDPINFAI